MVKLFGLACVPGSRKTSQHEAAQGVSQYTGVALPAVERLFSGSGVSTRGEAVCAPDEPRIWDYDHVLSTGERMEIYRARAVQLSRESVSRTLRRSNVPPSAITHLVTASCTGFITPGVDHDLIKTFDLPLTVERVHVGFMGCHAAVNALRVARALALTPGSVVLFCCVEICSVHLQPSPLSEDLVGAALFSDGASSALLSQNGPNGAPLIQSGISLYLPDGAELMRWKIGDQGFQMHLDSQLPKFLAAELPRSLVVPWTDRAKSIALHPGGGRLLRTVAEALKVSQRDREDSEFVLNQFGNMSSPTPLFVLERLLLRKAPMPIALLAFGPGIHAEGLMFEESR